MIDQSIKSSSYLQYLQEGGEMGHLTRTFDWSATVLGSPDTWSQSLLTTLSIILKSKFPMFLWWGPQLIQFYNDAYRPSLGNDGKHPTALGQRGEDCWPEIWPAIKPRIDQVMGGGESTWSEDELIPIYRNGRLEDVYWTFCYSQVNDGTGKTGGVLVTCQETTEKVLTTKRLTSITNAITESERKLRNIIEQAPVAMAIYTGPEFIIEVFNDKVLEFWGRTAEQVKNKPLFDALPEARNQGFEELLTNVLITGETLNASRLPVKLLRNGILETTWINFIYEPVRDVRGFITGVMVVCNEVTALVNASMKIEEAEERARLAIEAADLGTFDFDILTSQLITSARFDDMFWIQQPASLEDFMAMVHPDDRHKRKQAIESAYETGNLQYEVRVIKNDTVRWLQAKGKVYYDREGQPLRLLGSILDITLHKVAEAQLQSFAARLEQEVNERTSELKESRDKLQSIFDTTLMQMSILEAVRDENGEVDDLRIILVNKEHERVMGRTDLVGKLYVQEYPGLKQSVLFDLIAKTINTGEPQQTEYYYPYEGFNRWFSTMFVKLNDGIVAVNLDISERKKAEEERFKNYTLLQQSEELARLGNWDFDLISGVFTWSDGMYRLFNIETGTVVTPNIYLHYTTKAGRPAAERVVQHIKDGDADFIETLEMDFAGHINILHLKATVIRNERGQAVRVLGVDMDITASRKAEEKIRRLEVKQRQQIFRATLESQEEERRRISESLHNGLGQLLYGIKISMTHVTEQQAITKPEAYAKAKKYTEELLTDAIDESRRISHQLMPAILEDFGLKTAIKDVCEQLSSDVKFQCIFNGFDLRLDKYMELAIFRTIQELMLNVVKHSGATQATAEVIVSEAVVLIKVQDNGMGMQTSSENKAGIGLASIRSKVKLLNGWVKIESIKDQGTTVSVQMPYHL